MPFSAHHASPTHARAAIIGGGPAGLMAAEVLSEHGVQVHLYDAMPSLGRKFLMAGKSGLNLTHGEDFQTFLCRFGAAQAALTPALEAFTPHDIQAWAQGLGIATFVGTSGRVFPKDFKAAPLLRAWLHRLRGRGVTTHVRHRWIGWQGDALRFAIPNGEVSVKADATVLALGGASWPKLGSTGDWVEHLTAQGVPIAPLKPANCGFDVAWSAHLKSKFSGAPLKAVELSFAGQVARGDVTVTETGLESGPVYTLSAPLRDALDDDGKAVLNIDLLPDKNVEDLTAALGRPRGKKSIATHLKRTIKLDGAKVALLREVFAPEIFQDPAQLATAIKAVPIPLSAPRPLTEAISTAGGIRLDAVDAHFQLKHMPGVFVAGEMLDWEAPTGGYLLSACLATGRMVGGSVRAALNDTTAS